MTGRTSCIRQILVESWDPIGVGDTPRGMVEYEAFLGSVYHILTQGGTRDELVHFLCASEEELGLPPNREKAEAVATQLLALTSS